MFNVVHNTPRKPTVGDRIRLEGGAWDPRASAAVWEVTDAQGCMADLRCVVGAPAYDDVAIDVGDTHRVMFGDMYPYVLADEAPAKPTPTIIHREPLETFRGQVTEGAIAEAVARAESYLKRTLRAWPWGKKLFCTVDVQAATASFSWVDDK